MDEFKTHTRSGEIEHAAAALGEFVVAAGDHRVDFEMAVGALDEVAFAVEALVPAYRTRAV